MASTASLGRSTGSCPRCGLDVLHTHTYNGARLADVYACFDCGPTTYQVAAS